MKYLDTKTCVPTAFCNLVLQKQHAGLGVCRLRSWLVGWLSVLAFGCLVASGLVGWRMIGWWLVACWLGGLVVV